MSTSIIEPATAHAVNSQAAVHPRRRVQAWVLPLEAWRPRLEELQPVVDAAQRRRIATLRDPGLRRDRLLAHALHRLVVAQALGLPPELLPLYRNHAGQPRLGLPGLHTSLSHAAGVVAVALADGPVGVDVEARDTASLSPIADLVCAASELATLPADAPARQARLLATWVCKEAALKAAGVGLAREMASFDLRAGRPIVLTDIGGVAQRLHIHTHGEATPWIAALACASTLAPQWHSHAPAHPPIEFT
jgi:4'-phosphopantetheinyl transferase